MATRYLEIPEAPYIVFRVTLWHRDVARSLLKEPKIYFLDTDLVEVKLSEPAPSAYLHRCGARYCESARNGLTTCNALSST